MNSLFGRGFDSRRLHNSNMSDVQRIAFKISEMIVSATEEAARYRKDRVADYVPKLVIPKESSVDQRRYIKYKIWNLDKGKWDWAKDYEINKIPEAKRAKYLKETIQEYQRLLREGLQKSALQTKDQKEQALIRERAITLTISAAIEMGLKEKQSRKLRQIRNYENRAGIFLSWLKNRGYHRIPASSFKTEKIKEFVSFLRNVRNVAPRTINNYLLDLSTLMNVCVENEYLDKNFFPDVKKERVGIGKNWAYSVEQQKEILEHVRDHHPEYLMLIQFMYYTCARERELSLLKIEDIGKRHKDQIWFPEDNTKEIMERNIMIPKQLRIIIDDNKLDSYPGSWYVFSKNFRPGPEHYHSDNWGKRYGRMLRKISERYDLRHTLYSWKHTGVTALHLNGADLGAIQQHMGHRSPFSLIKYLKTLGLHLDKSIVDKFPDLPG